MILLHPHSSTSKFLEGSTLLWNDGNYWQSTSRRIPEDSVIDEAVKSHIKQYDISFTNYGSRITNSVSKEGHLQNQHPTRWPVEAASSFLFGVTVLNFSLFFRHASLYLFLCLYLSLSYFLPLLHSPFLSSSPSSFPSLCSCSLLYSLKCEHFSCCTICVFSRAYVTVCYINVV